MMPIKNIVRFCHTKKKSNIIHEGIPSNKLKLQICHNNLVFILLFINE